MLADNDRITPLSYMASPQRRDWMRSNWPAFIAPVWHILLFYSLWLLADKSRDSGYAYCLYQGIFHLADGPINYLMMLAINSRLEPYRDNGIVYVIWLVLTSAYWFIIGLGVVRFVRFLRFRRR